MVKNRESIEGLYPYVPGRPIEDVQKEYGLTEVVKLASNESPYGAPACAIEAARNAIDNISLYPDGACTQLREALSKKLCVSGKSIVFGTGADEVISLVAQAFLETDDEMITAQTTFGQYGASAAAMGAKVVKTPMKDWGYDLDAILSAITDKTKMIFITNPNNPTGTLLLDNQKTAFLDAVPNDVMVVFDEAYQEFVENEGYSSSVPLVSKYDNLVVLKTFSKIYGLASLRVGYGVMNEAYAAYIEKIRKPFNVTISAQLAAVAALGDDAFVKEAHKKNAKVKHFCYEALSEMKIAFVESEGNFILIDINKDCMAAFKALMSKGYIVRPGKPFGLNTHLRVTLGTMEQMEGFFKALKDVLSEI